MRSSRPIGYSCRTGRSSSARRRTPIALDAEVVAGAQLLRGASQSVQACHAVAAPIGEGTRSRARGGGSSNTGRLGSTMVQQNAPTRNSTPIRYSGRFQLPNHSTEYATMSGFSIAARLPTEFIVAPTTPTWLRPTSLTLPHAAPTRTIVKPVATAITVSARPSDQDAP